LKTVKSLYLSNRLTDFDEICTVTPIGYLQVINRRNFEFFKNQNGGGRQLENHKKRDISPTD